jgi:hypothetical protein
MHRHKVATFCCERYLPEELKCSNPKILHRSSNPCRDENQNWMNKTGGNTLRLEPHCLAANNVLPHLAQSVHRDMTCKAMIGHMHADPCNFHPVPGVSVNLYWIGFMHLFSSGVLRCIGFIFDFCGSKPVSMCRKGVEKACLFSQKVHCTNVYWYASHKSRGD